MSYEREEGPRETRELPLVTATGDLPVEFTVRARIPAWSSIGADAGDEIPLFECTRCPGAVVWGDRLHAHRAWHDEIKAKELRR